MPKVPASFVYRHPILRALEGWYHTPTYSFKLSCQFKDILRCSEFNRKTKHFTSCFSRDRMHAEQPRYRCFNPNWAIIYVPDKHGNFLGRAFVHLEREVKSDEDSKQRPPQGGWQLVIDRIYGNKLDIEDIRMNIRLKVLPSQQDTYLTREGL